MPESFRLHLGKLHPDSELKRMFGSSMRMEEEDEADGESSTSAACTL